MSHLLDSLLDADRRSQCEAHDAAMRIPFTPTKEQPMKHPLHLGRVFADMEATSEPDEGAEYEFSIIRFGRPDQPVRQWLADAREADDLRRALASEGAVVFFRPVGKTEQTYWSRA